MAFRFTCPYCFKKTLVDQSMVGQSGPCVCCGKEVYIPAPTTAQSPHQPPVASTSIAPGRPKQFSDKLAKVFLSVAGAMMLLVLVSVTLYVFWPTIKGLKARRDKVACMNNLSQIARALNAYAEQHGTYPPPVVYDAKGKPLHSWRVLILEQLGEYELQALYKLDEPWDSPNNVALLGGRCPRVYISPAVSNSRAIAETNYFLIVGNGTLFPSTGPLGPRNISDDPASTLLVVEAENTLIEWTKPTDIDFRKMSSRIGSGGANSIGGNHGGGATAAFADGSPAWLPDDIRPEMLDALITPTGGEPVNPDDFQLR